MENILIFLMFLDIRPFHKPACIFRLSALIMASYNALIISTTRLHTTLSLNGYLHKLLTLTGIMLRYCNANVSNHNGYFSTMTNCYKYLPLVFLENQGRPVRIIFSQIWKNFFWKGGEITLHRNGVSILVRGDFIWGGGGSFMAFSTLLHAVIGY